jgi:hypothetical protein
VEDRQMMILGLQIIASIVALVMIYFAYVNFRRREINKFEMAIWSTAWILALVMILFPDSLRKIAQVFFISRLLDLLILGGFFLVIVMVSMAYLRTRRIERKLEDLIRKEALKDIKKKSK